MLFAEIVVYFLLAYAAIGVAFGVYFAMYGVRKMDEAAKGAGLGFRLIIVPAAAAFWAVLLPRILRGAVRPRERNAHRAAAGARREHE